MSSDKTNEALERLAGEPVDELDLAILDQLGALLDALDPMPAHLVDEVRFALTLDALHAEIAQLQAGDLAAVRGEEALATPTESMTFTSSSLSLMIQVVGRAADGLEVDGWVTGGGITIEVLQGSARLSAVSDAHGRLSWTGVQRGPTRFLVHPVHTEGRPVITPTVEL